MRYAFLVAAAALALGTFANAETPKLPSGAIQLNGAEIGKWLDGKKFKIVIYDSDMPITAKTNWDLGGKRVYGTFVAGETEGKFDNPWVIKGDTSCTEKDAKGKRICQKVFIVGDVMYEVNSKGKVHAISEPR